MAIVNYQYNLSNGKTYSYTTASSSSSAGSAGSAGSCGSTGSMGSSGSSGSMGSTTTVYVGSTGSTGSCGSFGSMGSCGSLGSMGSVQIGSVGMLSFDVIVNQFMSGNLTVSEAINGLKAKGATVTNNYAGSNGMSTIAFKYNSKNYTISCKSSATASQIDSQISNFYTASAIASYKFTDADIAKYFVPAKTENGTVLSYAINPKYGYTSLSEVRTAVYQEYKNDLILDNFLGDKNRTKDTATSLYQTTDSNGNTRTLLETNYSTYADQIGLATGEEATALRREALNKFIEDFSNGNLAYAQTKSILEAIGVKSLTRKTVNDNYMITFKYEGKEYQVVCSKDAAIKGSDDVSVLTLTLDELSGEKYKNYVSFFEPASMIGEDASLYKLRSGYTEADLNEVMSTEGLYTPFQLEQSRFNNTIYSDIVDNLSDIDLIIAKANNGVKTETVYRTEVITYDIDQFPEGYKEISSKTYSGGSVVQTEREGTIYVPEGMTLTVKIGENSEGKTCESILKSGTPTDQNINLRYYGQGFVCVDNKVLVSEEMAYMIERGDWSVPDELKKLPIVATNTILFIDNKIMQAGSGVRTEEVAHEVTTINMDRKVLDNLVIRELEKTVEELNKLLNSRGITKDDYNSYYNQKVRIEQKLELRRFFAEIETTYKGITSLEDIRTSYNNYYSDATKVQNSFEYIMENSIEDPAGLLLFAQTMLIYKDSYYLNSEQVAILEKILDKIGEITFDSEENYKSSTAYLNLKDYLKSAEVQNLFKQFENNYSIATNGEALLEGSTYIEGDIYTSLKDQYKNLDDKAFNKLFNSAALTTKSAFSGYGTFAQANAFYEMMDYGAELVELFEDNLGMNQLDILNDDNFGVLMGLILNSKAPEDFVNELNIIYQKCNPKPTIEELLSKEGPLYAASRRNQALGLFVACVDAKVERERIINKLNDPLFLEYVENYPQDNIDYNSEYPLEGMFNDIIAEFGWSETDTLSVLSLMYEIAVTDIKKTESHTENPIWRAPSRTSDNSENTSNTNWGDAVASWGLGGISTWFSTADDVVLAADAMGPATTVSSKLFGNALGFVGAALDGYGCYQNIKEGNIVNAVIDGSQCIVTIAVALACGPVGGLVWGLACVAIEIGQTVGTDRGWWK